MTFVNLKKISAEHLKNWKETKGLRTKKPVDEADFGTNEKISICGGDKQHLVSVSVSTKEPKLSKFCNVIDVKYLTKFLNQLMPGMTSEQIDTIFHKTTENSTFVKR
jgi:hypothetical protein